MWVAHVHREVVCRTRALYAPTTPPPRPLPGRMRVCVTVYPSHLRPGFFLIKTATHQTERGGGLVQGATPSLVAEEGEDDPSPQPTRVSPPSIRCIFCVGPQTRQSAGSPSQGTRVQGYRHRPARGLSHNGTHEKAALEAETDARLRLEAPQRHPYGDLGNPPAHPHVRATPLPLSPAATSYPSERRDHAAHADSR